MNKTSKILLLIFGIAFFAITSCVKGEFDEPEINIPKANLEANKTIAELKAQFNGNLELINDDIIIKGIVVANDESGNLYKKIVIQDATGGIELSLDRNSLYTEYRLGQLIYIKLKDLYIGKYGGLHQIGYVFEGSIGRMPDAFIDKHLFRDSLPGAIPEPVAISLNGPINDKYLSMLVIFKNVHFGEPGQEWAPQAASATNRNMLDDLNNKIIVRTSKYANFAGELVPDGKGNVTAILGKFNADYQLTIRDLNDIKDFKPAEKPLFEETFATGMGGFVEYSVKGTQKWTHDATNKYMKMSGYQGTNFENEDWLISPEISLEGLQSSTISFDHTINKGAIGNLTSNHTLWISTNYVDGDPNSATWLKMDIQNYPAGNTWTFVNSGESNVPGGLMGQKVRFAFKYLSSNGESATWEIRNVKVSKQ